MSTYTEKLESTLAAMASNLEKAASDLRRLANQVGQDEDFQQVSEAIMIIQNMNAGLRIDRLINLPIEGLTSRLLSRQSTTPQ
ncbi:hypothetical protein DV532_25980 (plasmid) [Pseudomonas sp. Leaf58]|uniref:hypothetical protein n=1 Tax=Pseudomonas sp. Leaf58 TaxID=1736226 RepID=UPI0006FA13ED|nr:hypothetical protein [Pseudomonas sp. Leaf58]AYG47740.1 hypothetical protein DV532_25980 [Pseudomonas sp. Leaf58]KQN62695.1 hypothetical protein ASF02_11150 [Pseudomonas sp. Leaf58]